MENLLHDQCCWVQKPTFGNCDLIDGRCSIQALEQLYADTTKTARLVKPVLHKNPSTSMDGVHGTHTMNPLKQYKIRTKGCFSSNDDDDN
jgi:hypothetical protein